MEMEPRLRCKVRVLPAYGEDIPSIIRIDKEGYMRPWPRFTYDTFRRRHRGIRILKAVDVSNGEVVGFVVYMKVKGGILIIRMAVRNDRRRQGVGTQLVERLKEYLSVSRPGLFGAVREANGNAQIFLRSCGLECFNSVVWVTDLGEEFDVFVGDTFLKFRYFHSWEDE